jgi:hypothetical protein
MNSVALANQTWEWVKSCSIVPPDEVIFNHAAKIAKERDAEDFVLQNAWRRVQKRLSDLKYLHERFKTLDANSADGQSCLEAIGKLVNKTFSESANVQNAPRANHRNRQGCDSSTRDIATGR